jgi:hypothetical protein
MRGRLYLGDTSLTALPAGEEHDQLCALTPLDSPRGEVAQLVEHTAENRGVAGSIPALAMRGRGPWPIANAPYQLQVQNPRDMAEGLVSLPARDRRLSVRP